MLIYLHKLNQSCQIPSIARWVSHPTLFAIIQLYHTAILSTPLWKKNSIKAEIAPNCFILFINFFYINQRVPSKVWSSVRNARRTCLALSAMTFICQIAFFITVTPFQKVLLYSLARGRVEFAFICHNSNRAFKKRIAIFYLFNICQMLTSMY